MSASRSSSSGVARLPSAMPILAVTSRGASLPAISNGVANTSRMRSATTSAPAASEAPSANTTNSSPPSRPTVSSWRMALANLAATATSSWSPAAWPKVSLMSLKLSRSKKRTATGVCSRRDRASIRSIRSRINARLGSPVSESCRARWWSSWVRSFDQAQGPRAAGAQHVDQRPQQQAEHESPQQAGPARWGCRALRNRRPPRRSRRATRCGD